MLINLVGKKGKQKTKDRKKKSEEAPETRAERQSAKTLAGVTAESVPRFEGGPYEHSSTTQTRVRVERGKL